MWKMQGRWRCRQWRYLVTRLIPCSVISCNNQPIVTLPYTSSWADKFIILTPCNLGLLASVARCQLNTCGNMELRKKSELQMRIEPMTFCTLVSTLSWSHGNSYGERGLQFAAYSNCCKTAATCLWLSLQEFSSLVDQDGNEALPFLWLDYLAPAKHHLLFWNRKVIRKQINYSTRLQIIFYCTWILSRFLNFSMTQSIIDYS